ncbi:hypothetical protein [uncultured Desulfobacter sp.]|uniref:hypothetical protein n=1 Tax=uncultured Desulfobacter sp. TaxID=240139 RepID=UPI0029F4D925|nr:hypothetical protein [uncultured Desulfobacter sp.]
MFDWINKNKTWLFSGVGVAIITAALSLFWNKNQNINVPNQSSFANGGDSSVVVSVSGTAKGINIYQPPLSNIPAQQTTPLPVGISPQRSNDSDIEVTLLSVQTGLVKRLYLPPRRNSQSVTQICALSVQA